jgi:hypothetical protein
MLPFKDKELLFIAYGFTVHKPNTNEASVIAGILFVLFAGLNFRFPAPMTWSLIGLSCAASAAFDLIPAAKPLRTLVIGLIVGAAMAFIACK